VNHSSATASVLPTHASIANLQCLTAKRERSRFKMADSPPTCIAGGIMNLRRLVAWCFFFGYVVSIVAVATAVTPRHNVITPNGAFLNSVFENLPGQPGFSIVPGKITVPPCASTTFARANGASSPSAMNTSVVAKRTCGYCSFLPLSYGCNEPPCSPTLCQYTGTPSDGCEENYSQGCSCARDIDCPGCGI